MLRATALAAALGLAACGPAVKLAAGLAGGGPNVAANVQAGATNSQTVGATDITKQTIDRPTAHRIEQVAGTTKVRAEEVRTVVVNELPAWAVFMLVLGWLLPSPGEMGRWARVKIFGK